ncbi:MAG: hypothetical protein RBS80_13960 [Thermoguttaceae bacterium]|jgi:hypothetical protein|nr:hypothetical protein [Thermoguttaceae bacterium]
MAKAFGLALACMALFGVAAETGSDDRVEALLQQVARLEPDQQQRFLFWIESRLNRANAVVLSAQEAAAARATLHRNLRRETVTWPELRLLLGELDRHENLALQELTRQYHLRTLLGTFRSSRDTSEQREQAWLDVYAVWQAAGRPLARQHELLDWLTTAADRSTAGTVAGLPAVPSFAADSLASLLPVMPTRQSLAKLSLPQPAPAAPTAAPDPPVAVALNDPPAPTPAPDPPAEVASPDRPATVAAPDPPSPPAAPEPPAAVAGPSPPVSPALPALAQKVAVSADRLDPAALTVRKRVAAFAAGGDGQTPTASDSAPVLPAGTAGSVAPDRSARRSKDPQIAALPPGSLPQRTTSAAVSAMGEAASVPEMAVSPTVPVTAEPIADTVVSERPAEKRQTLPGRPPLPSAITVEDDAPQVAGPDRSEAMAKPGTALARNEHGMSRTVRELPITFSDAEGRPREEASPKEASPFIAEKPLPAATPEPLPKTETGETGHTQPAVVVNVEELRSRTAGTNMALQALEAELHERRDWNIDELARLVTRLHTLTLRVEDMHLFREIVPEETRRLISAVDSPRPAITLVASKIAEARQRIIDGPYHGTEAERQGELAQLDEFSRRLVEIADKTPQ